MNWNSRQHFFTLLEAVAVLAIVILVTAAVLPYWKPGNASEEASSSLYGEKLLTLIRSARMEAIRTGHVQEIFWDEASRAWCWTGHEDKRLSLPLDAAQEFLSDVSPDLPFPDDEKPVQRDKHIFRISETGDMESCRIRIQVRNDDPVELTSSPLTGAVRLVPSAAHGVKPLLKKKDI